VKRLLSDFLHAKADHKKHRLSPNSLFLGKKSKMYPFDSLNFDNFVDKYLPIQPQLTPQNPIFTMFSRGLFKNTYIQKKLGHQFILVNGTQLKFNPSQTMEQIEKKIFQNSTFFKANHFVKQNNGLFCFK